MLRLVKVDTKNFDSLIDLTVNKEQEEFVADNCYSIAEAYATNAEGRVALPFGIYDGEVPVGFLMIGYDCRTGWTNEVPEFAKTGYEIWRFMIDRKFQGKGYGREAMQLALDYIRTFPCGESEWCWLSYAPQNDVARNLYLSFGFQEKPEYYEEGDEMPAALKL